MNWYDLNSFGYSSLLFQGENGYPGIPGRIGSKGDRVSTLS